MIAVYPYKVNMIRLDWTPDVQRWFIDIIGPGNFKYCKSSDNFTYLRYGFKNEEDALAFKLRFGIT